MRDLTKRERKIKMIFDSNEDLDEIIVCTDNQAFSVVSENNAKSHQATLENNTKKPERIRRVAFMAALEVDEKTAVIEDKSSKDETTGTEGDGTDDDGTDGDGSKEPNITLLKEGSIADLKEALKDENSVELLEAYIATEKENQNRVGALDFLTDKIAEIINNTEVDLDEV